MRCVNVLIAIFLFALSGCAPQPEQADGPIRVLFLGHKPYPVKSHAPYDRLPELAAALGRDAIYFDYVDDAGEALTAERLEKYDALLIYANYDEDMTDAQFAALDAYVRGGGGLVAVHSASASFTQRGAYLDMIGGQFLEHGLEEFSAVIVAPEHPAMANVQAFSSVDETYVHEHRGERTVLMERRDGARTEPWTWVREHGAGRVFYTASGHDERTWRQAGFHALLKAGVLWAVGDERRALYEAFLAARAPLRYERRDFIPNYEKRPEPLAYQLPLPPEESLKYTQVPVGFSLELAAAEPIVVNPIAMAWDERGRLWVAETVDYPNDIVEKGGNDRIVILEDRNNDGLMDKRTIFADGFNVPTSLVFANGGVIVAAAPDFVFLRDEDGDGKADTRKVILSGWGKFDTHAGPSNLRYGLDNWIYGAVGYAGFDGEVAGEAQKFSMGLFRMKPDGSALEFLHQFNNNTWGLGIDESGGVFGSTANGNPSFFGAIPAKIAARAGAATPNADAIFDTARVAPITPNVRQVDMFGEYTAGAGHAFANSSRFPSDMRGQVVFVSEPTAHLVGRFRISPKGASYQATRQFPFLASADEWVSPIAAEVGPDGDLWVLDWYEFIIQHNPTPTIDNGGFDGETGAGNAHVNPNRDRDRGRIYRIRPDDAPTAKIASLRGAGDKALVRALDDPNQFWRLTAQRLLVEGRRTDSVAMLRKRARGEGVGALHAFWTLAGLQALTDDDLAHALRAVDPAMRKNGLRAAADLGADASLIVKSGVMADADLQVRLVAFNTLGLAQRSEAARSAVLAAVADPSNREDPWLRRSLKLLLTIHADMSAQERAGLLYGDASAIQGDPRVGETIWWTSNAASCNVCHKAFGYGGDVGPPLDGIGRRRSADYLRRALLDPNADIAPGFSAPSAMPAMGAILDEEDVAHVVAYLQTLQ